MGGSWRAPSLTNDTIINAYNHHNVFYQIVIIQTHKISFAQKLFTQTTWLSRQQVTVSCNWSKCCPSCDCKSHGLIWFNQNMDINDLYLDLYLQHRN